MQMRFVQATLLCITDKAECSTILDAAARIEIFNLCQDGRGDALGDVAEPDQRGVADQLDDVVVVAHLWHCPSLLRLPAALRAPS